MLPAIEMRGAQAEIGARVAAADRFRQWLDRLGFPACGPQFLSENLVSHAGRTAVDDRLCQRQSTRVVLVARVGTNAERRREQDRDRNERPPWPAAGRF